MALPNNKIDFTLVGNTLGTSTRLESALCTHQAINKWSKWKPIRYNTGNNPLTEAQLVSRTCGLVRTTHGTPRTLVEAYDALPDRKYSFTYLKPRGVLYNEGYRIGDFRNYEHTANKFYNIGGHKNTVFRGDGPIPYYMSITNRIGNLSLSDMGWDNTHKFGVAIISHTGYDLVRGYSTPFTSPQGTWYANVPVTSLSPGLHRAYAFIADQYESNLYMLEDGYIGQFTLASSAIRNHSSGYVYANSNGYNFRVTYTVSIENISNNPVTIPNLTMDIKYPGPDPGYIDFGEVRRNFGTITIQPGQSYVQTGSAENCLDQLFNKSGSPRLIFTPAPADATIILNRPSGV